MAETHRLTCIGCPLGCLLAARVEGEKVVAVEGNRCGRGAEYAETECIRPVRMLTTTVPLLNGEIAMLPVKTRDPVPRAMLAACMESLRRVTAAAPVRMGDVVAADIAGTGIDVVATRGAGASVS